MNARFLPLLLAVFLLPLTAPVHAQTATHAATYEPVADKPGDVSVFGLPLPVSAVTPPPAAPYDLVEMGIIEEDEVGIKFYVKVANLNGDVDEVSRPDGQFDLWATLDGSHSTYDITWYPTLPGPLTPGTGVQAVDARMCVSSGNDQNGGISAGPGFAFTFCNEQPVEATIDFGTNTLTAYVTKDALMAPPAGPAGSGPKLAVGSRLTQIYAQSQAYFIPPWTDRLPDDGSAPIYTFSAPAANTRVRLTVDQGSAAASDGNASSGGPGPSPPPQPGGNLAVSQAPASTEVSVVPGQPTLVRLRVANDAPAKRLVNLTASLAPGAAANKWELQIVPSVRVPSGDSRVVNLIVNASASLQHRDRATVVVRGQSLGAPDEIAALRLHLIASVPPGPARQHLYLHGAPQGQAGFFDPVCAALGCGNAPRTWMNTLDEDATGTLDAAIPMEQRGFGGQGGLSFRSTFALDAPVSDALLLDTTKPVTAVLAFQAQVEFSGQVDVELYTTQSNRALGGGSSSGPIKAGAPMTVTFLPLADQGRVGPEDGGLALLIEVRTNLVGAGATAFFSGINLVAKDSEVNVPFLVNPEAHRVTLTAGPAFLSLSAQSDHEEFLNPARAKIFNATVVNEGVETDDARLEILYDNPKWAVELFPGVRFHLSAGDSAKFAVLVHAPADAKEGDQLHVLVNATSETDRGVLSQLAFTAIVTKDLDIPDESHFYLADADSAGKVVANHGRNTPGFEVPVMALALGFLVALVRRPRH